MGFSPHLGTFPTKKKDKDDTGRFILKGRVFLQTKLKERLGRKRFSHPSCAVKTKSKWPLCSDPKQGLLVLCCPWLRHCRGQSSEAAEVELYHFCALHVATSLVGLMGTSRHGSDLVKRLQDGGEPFWLRPPLVLNRSAKEVCAKITPKLDISIYF